MQSREINEIDIFHIVSGEYPLVYGNTDTIMKKWFLFYSMASSKIPNP